MHSREQTFCPKQNVRAGIVVLLFTDSPNTYDSAWHIIITQEISVQSEQEKLSIM